MLRDWKVVTHQFDDSNIWQNRLNKLEIPNDSLFNSYLSNLKTQSLSIAAKAFFNNLSEFYMWIDKNRLQRILEDEEDAFSYGMMILTVCAYKSLEERFTLIFCGYKRVKKNAFKKMVDRYMQMQNPLIINILKREYRVYLTAYKKEDTKSNLNDFIINITNSTSWISYFIEEYPVLAEKLYTLQNNFLKSSEIFFRRTTENIDNIYKFFDIDTNVEIVEFEAFLGDIHKDGHTTASITFGNDKKVFYKPRGLEGELFFHNLINLLHEYGLCDFCKLPRLLLNVDFGWQEEVEYIETKSIKEIRQYYYHMGILASIATILNMQDLIADNIIAYDKYPALFDIEMVCLPVQYRGRDYRQKSKSNYNYNYGIIKTGIIPILGFETASDGGFSNSGISKIQRKGFSNQNLPSFNDIRYEANNYICEFERGCLNGFNFLLEKKTLIINWIKSQNFNFDIRVLVRYTYVYSGVLKELNSPLASKSFYNSKKIEEYLWRGYDGFWLTANIIQNEINQLDGLNIPYFKTKFLSLDLYNDKNEVVEENFFDINGKNNVIERIKNIDLEYIREQMRIINNAFIVHFDKEPKAEGIAFTGSSTINAIGNYLLKLDSSKDDYFSYIDFYITKDGAWEQGIQDCNIFNGIEGLGVYFLAKYKSTKQNKYLVASQNIFNQSIELLRNNHYSIFDMPNPKIGISNFPISTIYFSYLSKKILGDDGFEFSQKEYDIIIEYIQKKIQTDRQLDYLTGSSGLFLLLYNAFSLDNPDIHKICYNAMENICNSIHEVKSDSVTWERKSFDKWGGFAHGNAGMAYSLFKAADIFQNDKFYSIAKKALKYDQDLLNTNTGIYSKSFTHDGDIHFGWATGNAGIALSRFLISNYYNDDRLENEIAKNNSFLQSHLEQVIQVDHSIASGYLGIIEILSIINPHFSVNKYLNKIKKVNSIVDLKCSGWNKDILLNGLYYGIAGIDYNIIKLSEHEVNLPSLLYL